MPRCKGRTEKGPSLTTCPSTVKFQCVSALVSSLFLNLDRLTADYSRISYLRAATTCERRVKNTKTPLGNRMSPVCVTQTVYLEEEMCVAHSAALATSEKQDNKQTNKTTPADSGQCPHQA